MNKIPIDSLVEDMDSKLDTNCLICNGAGFVHPTVNDKTDYSIVVICKCRKEEWENKKREFMLNKCQLPINAESMTFENFEVYPEVKLAYNDSKEIAGHPGDVAWLALIGRHGNGKTHLAVSICRAWLDAGIPAKYELVSLLLEELRQGLNKDGGNSYSDKFQYYCNVPLLLLDDYGIESSTKWVQEKLDTIIDYRMMNNLSLIITSNLSLDDMPPRIRSRILRHPKGRITAIMSGEYSLREKATGGKYDLPN